MSEAIEPTTSATARIAMIASGTALIMGAHAIAWRLEDRRTWMLFLVAYAIAGALACLQMRRDEELIDGLRPVSGDVAKGVVTGAAALAVTAAIAFAALKYAPEKLARDLFAPLKSLVAIATMPGRAAAIVVYAALSELFWRGGVMSSLARLLGSTRAAIAAGLLAVVAVTPSIHPSIILATLAISSATTLLARITRRLLPSILAHIVFAWFAAAWLVPVLWERLAAIS